MVQAVRTWVGRTLYVRQQWGRYLFEAGRITSGLSVVDENVRPNLGNSALSFLVGNLRRNYSNKTPSWHVVRKASLYATAS